LPLRPKLEFPAETGAALTVRADRIQRGSSRAPVTSALRPPQLGRICVDALESKAYTTSKSPLKQRAMFLPEPKSAFYEYLRPVGGLNTAA
jgi:hypothetical protein